MITMPDIIPMSDIVDCNMSSIITIKTNRGEYSFDYVIVATGGISYPSTGSTGDGYVMAKTIGHTITDLQCGLCGINTADVCEELQGLALKNVRLTVKHGQKNIYSDFGELLFTHFGISGPIVLSTSSKINRINPAELECFLDLKPALDEQTLDKRLLRDFETYKNKQIINALVDLFPQKLIAFVLSKACINSKKNVSVITKEERARLLKTIKALPLKIAGLRGFNEAIITSGGVSLSEINPKTMESKKCPQVKFCGEVLDVDAFTGGFNMQIAFATGFVAGNTID